MSLVFVVMVVAVAYGSQAPGLAVAEFSPTANSALDAPPTTGGPQDGSGARGGRRSTTTTAPATSASTQRGGTDPAVPTTRVGRSRQCVGDPPRQIEDPMSPPCIATIFEGDNGGATSRGVSATEIRVAVPISTWRYGMDLETMDGLFEFFNDSFELYGRRIVPIFVTGDATDAVKARALASELLSHDIFASLTGIQEQYDRHPQPGLVQELVRQETVTIARATASWWSDKLMYDPSHPYLWSVFPSAEDMQRNLASATCRLAGRDAAHTKDPDLAGEARRFGVASTGRQSVPSASIVIDALTNCTGVRPVTVQWTELAGGTARTTGLAKLAEEGVTDVVCVCEGMEIFNAMDAARGASYGPEWIFASSTLWDDEADLQYVTNNDKAGPIIQVQPGRRWLPMQERPWFRALIGTHPEVLADGYQSIGAAIGVGESLYDSLLVLAAGLQGAGPNLTPESFAAALMTAQFSNPGAGQPPHWQPSAGFGPGDHSFYDDYAVGWFSQNAPAQQPFVSRPTGSWCFVDRGARYTVDRYPADLDAKLFNESLPCR